MLPTPSQSFAANSALFSVTTSKWGDRVRRRMGVATAGRISWRLEERIKFLRTFIENLGRNLTEFDCALALCTGVATVARLRNLNPSSL